MHRQQEGEAEAGKKLPRLLRGGKNSQNYLKIHRCEE